MDQTRKLFSNKYRWLAILTVAVCFSFNSVNATAASDSLTGLPIYPGVTDPGSLPESDFCGKRMQKDFYIVMGGRIDGVTKWYASHLAGYHKYHAVTDGRSQDTFFNPNGSTEVTVTATKAGSAVYSISYGRFEPGLTAREMIWFSQSRKTCD
jgi:hypothetical protein